MSSEARPVNRPWCVAPKSTSSGAVSVRRLRPRAVSHAAVPFPANVTCRGLNTARVADPSMRAVPVAVTSIVSASACVSVARALSAADARPANVTLAASSRVRSADPPKTPFDLPRTGDLPASVSTRTAAPVTVPCPVAPTSILPTADSVSVARAVSAEDAFPANVTFAGRTSSSVAELVTAPVPLPDTGATPMRNSVSSAAPVNAPWCVDPMSMSSGSVCRRRFCPRFVRQTALPLPATATLAARCIERVADPVTAALYAPSSARSCVSVFGPPDARADALAAILTRSGNVTAVRADPVTRDCPVAPKSMPSSTLRRALAVSAADALPAKVTPAARASSSVADPDARANAEPSGNTGSGCALSLSVSLAACPLVAIALKNARTSAGLFVVPTP